MLYHLKDAGYFKPELFQRLFAPTRDLSFDSCDPAARRTGNAYVVYLSEATGQDMASFVASRLRIPAAGSLAAAKAELGLP